MNPEAYLEMAATESRHWWFSGRRAILFHLIQEMYLPKNAKILEIGSGTGGNLEMLSAFGRVSALEMDPVALSIANEKTKNVFDIRSGSCPLDIPFEGEKFDLICAFDVLEHIDQDLETLARLKQFLSEKGSILVTVPANRWLWGQHDEYLHHKRRYSANELRTKAVASGYRIEKLTYFNTILFPLAVIARLKDRIWRNKSATGSAIPLGPINSLFSFLFGIERFLIAKYKLPYGVSLLCVLK